MDTRHSVKLTHRGAYMTKRDLCRFERVLEGLRVESVQALQNGLGRMIATLSADPMDQTRAKADQELDAQTASLKRARLRGLEDALRAIHAGHFGRCTGCGCEIPLKRLKAVPWSQTCVACQQIGELHAAGEVQIASRMHTPTTWPGLNRVSAGTTPVAFRRNSASTS